MTIFRSGWTLFGLLAIFVLLFLFGGPENATDVALIHALEDIRHAYPQLTSFLAVVTQVGSAYATLGAGIIASIWLLATRRRQTGMLLLAATLLERLALDGLKLIVGRPRPDFDLHPVMTHSSSFPSGHSANTMGIFLMVAAALSPPAWRRPALALAASGAVISGLTRPFLGVHWPSDVLGGWTLGLIAFWLFLFAGERSGALRLEQQHEIVGRHGATSGEAEAVR